MKKQVYNPYLPLYEYIPDGEPHVFNGRVYVYGSHDKFGAFQFCHNNYVTWSAPLDDLSDWRFEGEILDKKEDPDNKNGKLDLYAPDVTQGPDGKFYIYYAYDWIGKIGVAVSDSPAGPFHYLGHVHYQDGTELGRRKGDAFAFDPGVLTDDDGKVYLYSGFGATSWFPQIKHGLKPEGCFCFELANDMLTIVKGPVKVMPKRGEEDKPGAKGHEFFEASSIRKIKGEYYLVYSAFTGHELCYARSKSPFGPFVYGGVIIDNGDVYLNGRTAKDAIYPLGNNHGGIVNILDKWYIFYHRHTNYTNTDRQGMAEEIHIEEDGSIKQVEKTCCGLNGGPLAGSGSYPASICSHLIPKKGNVFYPFFALPWQKGKFRITQSGLDSEEKETQYIQNLRAGDRFGYRYFDLRKTTKVILKVKGNGAGKMKLETSDSSYAEDVVKGTGIVLFEIKPGIEKDTLMFTYEGKGKLDVYGLDLG